MKSSHKYQSQRSTATGGPHVVRLGEEANSPLNVVGVDLAFADALTSALVIASETALPLINSATVYEGLAVVSDGAKYMSPSFSMSEIMTSLPPVSKSPLLKCSQTVLEMTTS